MTKLDDMILALNTDLWREYAHWHFYMNAATMVTGLHREEYQELFTKEAQGEMKHILEFGQLILGLGGIPKPDTGHFTTTGLDTRPEDGAVFRTVLRKPRWFVEEAISMEKEVVRHYVQRMDEAELLESEGGESKVHGRYIHIFLEDKILDSRHTIDHLTQCL